jgi:CRISPR-associated protein Csa3
MTLFVITLGFEEKFAVRMITRHGLDKGDRLLLVTGPRTPQSDRAASFLSEFARRYYGGEVAVEVEEVRVSQDFAEMVARLYELVEARARRGERVVFNLSGGMRALCLAAFTAALLLSPRLPVEVELETEDSSVLVEVPRAVLALPQTLSSLSREKLEVLAALSRGARTARELSDELGRDETTVRRHLQELVEAGLAETLGGRPREHKLTRLGELVLKTLLREPSPVSKE